MKEAQVLVVCEGYEDRAFLGAWLEYLGMSEHRVDPWGRPVAGGEFGYVHGSRFVRVVPSHGRPLLPVVAATYLRGHPTRPVERLVLCHDLDKNAPTPVSAGRDDVKHAVEVRIGESAIADIAIEAIVWGSDDPAGTRGVPDLQTLERLVTSAIAEIHPDRAASVTDWLAAAPSLEGSEHKAVAYSYLAKWHADAGCDRFYRAIWDDTRVRPHLERRLRATGAWDILAALV